MPIAPGSPAARTVTAATGRDRRRRSLLRSVGAGLAVLPVLAVPLAGAGGAQAAAAPAAAIRSVHPVVGSDYPTLKVAMQNLTAGQTLKLDPGTYDIGQLSILAHAGTRAARITVTATDPRNPPLLRGVLRLSAPTYWVISGIRVQATLPGTEAMSIDGGNDWIIANSEFFGASDTDAYTNVVIGAVQHPAPENFRFTKNCVHGAGTSTRKNTDHNIYVNFHGNPSSGGEIDHNLIFNHPNGAGIKIGDGGVPNAPGPWHVNVAYNTIVEGGRQVLLHGDVRYNAVQYNIISTSRTPFMKDPRTTALYVSSVPTRTNRIRHNYFYRASMVSYDVNHRLVDGGDDIMRGDPGYKQIGSCSGWHTTASASAPYGRYAGLG